MTYGGEVADQVAPSPGLATQTAPVPRKPGAMQPIPAERSDDGKPLPSPKSGAY